MKKKKSQSSPSPLEATVDSLAAAKANRQHAKTPTTRKERSSRKWEDRTLRRKARKLKVPKTVQDSIPYVRVYPDSGIIETKDGTFSKTWVLNDVNYQSANTEEQTDMFLKYAEFLNSMDLPFEITTVQQALNRAQFEAETMMPMRGDGHDDLRQEQNDILRSKIREGRNELIKTKYLTVSANADSYELALTTFARLDVQIASDIKKIGGASASALSTAKRLELLHDIYNPDSVGLFGNNAHLDEEGNLVFDQENFRFDIMRRMGLSTKDCIAPPAFSFRSNYGMVGDTYFRVLFLRTVPTTLKDTFLKELTDVPCKMVTSLLFQPIDMETALKMVRNDQVNVNASLIKKQKAASKAGYSASLVSPEIQDAADDARELRNDLTAKSQKLFYMTFVVAHFADTREQLDNDTKALQAAARSHLVDLRTINWQQENGLDTCLPLCANKLEIRRTLISESAAVFMPFVNQELNDRSGGGLYYGNNAVSNNLIMINRRNSKNGNGMILGSPGTGKSMSAKQEMLSVLMSSDDVVIVIDPDGEYAPLAQLWGGEVIRIAPGSDVHINPFDLELDSESTDDPISIKSDFINSLCESIVANRFGLTAAQRSIIDRCVQNIYVPYFNSYDPVTDTYDQTLIPTLLEFYQELRKQDSYEASQLADGLEIYVTGSQDLFAYPSNVKYKSRFVVYDIRDIGTTMKNLGLLVVLDNIWNRIVAGRKEGRFVWFYIDEIYLLFKTDSSAEFLRNLYKRARKYGGLPTGITQNVEDLLRNETARTMISNCDFVMMLSQPAVDRAMLADLLKISPTQIEYITNAPPGHGLIYDGSHIVPFVNRLPKESKQYQVMTTKLAEVKARENQTEEAQ